MTEMVEFLKLSYTTTTDGLKKFIEEISSNSGADKKLMKLTGHVVSKRQSNRHRWW